MNAVLKFSAICVGWIFAGIGLIWAFRDSGIAEISGHGVIALVIGVVLTVALSVALMALTFYSSRLNGRESPEPR